MIDGNYLQEIVGLVASQYHVAANGLGLGQN